MRVTGNYFTNGFLNRLNTLAANQQRLQNQVSTGQRISAPEDDPAAVQRTLGLQAEQKQVLQYSTNIASLQDRAMASFNVLKSVKSVSDRAGEIATLADGTKSPVELKSYAAEVTQMIKQAVQTMNGKHNDSYLFGGTQGSQPPFTMATDANGNVMGVTYQGNTEVAQGEVEAGVTLGVDVPGANSTGSGARGVVADSRSGADFFNHLISLQNNLLAGNATATTAINTTDLPNLKKDEENLIGHITNNGALQTRLETSATIAGNRKQSLSKMVSQEADANITDTIVQLNQAQYAYQAALQSGAGIMKTSLLDYLR